MSADPVERVIVVTGEALVDLVLDRDGGLVGHPGGGPFNVARTIGRLGQPAAYLGRISTDCFGSRLRRELDADGQASYQFYAAGTSAPGLTLEAATAALPERIGTFYLGTLGLVFEPIASTLEAVVSRLDETTLVALDPNCRPAAIDDPTAYRGRLGRLLQRTDLVKASEDDLAWLSPGVDAVTAARGLLAQDRAGAVVTRGGEGALVATAADVREIRAPAVDVIDTIGAGDSFMGALLAHWHDNGLGRDDLGGIDELTAAAEFACRVAAITCSRAGADPPRRSEL